MLRSGRQSPASNPTSGKRFGGHSHVGFGLGHRPSRLRRRHGGDERRRACVQRRGQRDPRGEGPGDRRLGHVRRLHLDRADGRGDARGQPGRGSRPVSRGRRALRRGNRLGPLVRRARCRPRDCARVRPRIPDRYGQLPAGLRAARTRPRRAAGRDGRRSDSWSRTEPWSAQRSRADRASSA